MQRSPAQLREDALAIWHAAVAAVRSDRLVRDHVQVEPGWLTIADSSFPLESIRRIVVVGAGKAGAGMAAGLEESLGDRLLQEKHVEGVINVPADCLRPMRRIRLHAARPAGVNEPTAEGVRGTLEILDLVSKAQPDDLCICLLSGGGSALLPAPASGISLEDKLAVTRHLSGAGANIQQLNTVRKQLSRVKGGGLARACRAGQLVTLIISDVLGDPLDVIASGPTVTDQATPAQALEILKSFRAADSGIAPRVFEYLENAARHGQTITAQACQVANFVIGNNATAVDAAGVEAERRGYSHAMVSARTLEGEAESIGVHLANMAWQMQDNSGPDCLITGGEPVVRLVDASERGKGGRNQQLVLAALKRLLELASASRLTAPNDLASHLRRLVLLSGGTDGEDGPTDAAGALIDELLVREMGRLNLSPEPFLNRNNAYPFFQQLGGLLKTGPTHTNVCDVRVVTVSQAEPTPRVANR